ncbi:MAG TPA: DDE-type integrase/transposase/recombinase, partial [Phycisphaerae bacterium]|nr:DDE-type integrase/transposase/recombinase [Phycisphaerae bacterium]
SFMTAALSQHIQSRDREGAVSGATGGLPTSVSGSDYLPIDEAAALTGLSIWSWRRRALAQAARGSLAFQAPPRSGNGKPVWWVHRSLDSRLAPCPTHDTRADRVRESLLARFPAHHVEAAYRKYCWLRRWRGLVADSEPTSCGSGPTSRGLAAQVVIEAKRLEGDDCSISVRALQLWHKAYNQLGLDGSIRGLEALVPKYSRAHQSRDGDQSRDPNQSRDREGAVPGRSSEAIDYFYSIYHSQAKHSAKTCHEATVLEARRQGWSWPESYSATLAWLREHDRLDETCLQRDGIRAYSKRFLPHVEIDWTAIQPGEFYVCDHTECDFWVTHRDRQIRPWLTTIIDCRSRCVVGWHLGDSPHQDAILAALRMAFKNWAVPERIRIDQGKDFTSELLTGVTKKERHRLRRELGPQWRDVLRDNAEVFWTGVLGELGIEVIYAIPYHAWSKGIVERWYGTFEAQCAKTFPTYCGNNPVARPECLQELRADPANVPSFDESRERVAEMIELYHHAEHRGLEGGTPLAIWGTATRLRRAEDKQLLALMQARGVYRVGANGVRFRVGGTTLGYGAESAPLRRLVGRDVFITLDPADLSHCQAYTADRSRYVGRLEANERIPGGASIDEVREAIRKVASRRKTFTRAAREAPDRLCTAAQEVRRLKRAQLAELRKTGTDDVPGRGFAQSRDRKGAVPGATGGLSTAAPGGEATTPRVCPNIVPVQTRFEAASTAVRKPASGPRRDRKATDLATAKAILGAGLGLPRKHSRRPRATDDLLRGGPVSDSGSIVTDSDGEDHGTDAGPSATDLLRLIGRGVRHDRQ